MASFSDAAFSQDGFSVNAFDFGTPGVTETPFRPGVGFTSGPSTHWDDILRRRRELGIREEVHEIIEKVAERQVKALSTDDQQNFEELERELELKGLEWDAKYLEALNLRRELLIEQEIALLLKKRKQDNDAMLLIMIAGSI